MAKDYSNYSKKELINEIEELKQILKSNKYGLCWNKDNTKEQIVSKCENELPILEIDNSRTIINGDTNNIIIEGDNFHSLTALNLIKKESIDLIYIDPPYNTGHEDFVYNDKFVDEEDGYRHSKWLNFMQKRLLLARELLTEDGVIFISIDDNEQANLKLLCDSIFGEHNIITQFIWEKTQHFGRQKINYYSNCEYILCYAKKKFSAELGKLKELLVEKVKTELTDAPLYNASNRENILTFKPGIVKFNMKDGVYSKSTNESYELLGPVEIKYGKNVNNLILKFKSRWSQKTIDEEIKKGTTFWVKSEGFAIRAIYHDGKTANESPKQLIFTNVNNPLCAYTRFNTKVGVNEEGSNELNKLVTQNIFSYPKPVSLIKYLLNMYYDYRVGIHKKEFTILDFFAGSGTTGQAVLELNKEDNGNRKFIICTNNENNICTNVTYPRIKAVITGKKHDGTVLNEGIPSNLYYYKTNFIPNEKNTDQTKYMLVEKVDALLSIMEDIHNEVERTTFSVQYSSNQADMFIYNDYYNEENFNYFKQQIKNISSEKKKIIYMFSTDNIVDEALFNDLDNVIIKPIPSKIYEIYKEIVEEIKRG